MKALWKCTPEEDVEGEFSQTLMMESEDIELLKRKGYEIAREYESSDSQWVRGPNNMEQYQMELSNGLILTIR